MNSWISPLFSNSKVQILMLVWLQSVLWNLRGVSVFQAGSTAVASSMKTWWGNICRRPATTPSSSCVGHRLWSSLPATPIWTKPATPAATALPSNHQVRSLMSWTQKALTLCILYIYVILVITQQLCNGWSWFRLLASAVTLNESFKYQAYCLFSVCFHLWSCLYAQLTCSDFIYPEMYLRCFLFATKIVSSL